MISRFILIFSSIPGVFAAVLFQTGELRAAEVAKPSERPPLYARVCEPRVKPAFLPLPIGAVEPQGWLRDWAKCARNGITGHLDEWNPVFADGWKGTPIQPASSLSG